MFGEHLLATELDDWTGMVGEQKWMEKGVWYAYGDWAVLHRYG